MLDVKKKKKRERDKDREAEKTKSEEKKTHKRNLAVIISYKVAGEN